MEQTLVKINNKELLLKDWKRERIITVHDIARVHNKEVKEINRVLKNNKERFILEKDYFVISKENFMRSFESTAYKEVNKINNNLNILLFTERGYLKLVKLFRDDLSWEIQDLLIDNYFRFKKLAQDFQLPKTFGEALILAGQQQLEIERLEIENKEKQDKIEIQEQIITDYEPKVSYYDTILQSQDVMTVTQIGSDYGLSTKELNKILCEKRIQRKVNGSYILYKEHMNKGYTKSKTFNIETRKGTVTKVDLRWTQKGRLFIHKILLDLGIYAEMDKENDYIERNLF